MKHVKQWEFAIDSLLIYVFCTNCEHKISFFFDLQNWQNNFRLTTFTKYANKQRIGRRILVKLNKSWICPRRSLIDDLSHFLLAVNQITVLTLLFAYGNTPSGWSLIKAKARHFSGKTFKKYMLSRCCRAWPVCFCL